MSPRPFRRSRTEPTSPADGGNELPRLLVTGSSGTIGRVLAGSWPAERLRPFDLPDDARNARKLIKAARSCDVIVHLAWDVAAESAANGLWVSGNSVMTVNALECAVDAGVGRVVLASSVHADTYWPPSDEPLDPLRPPTPDSPYGASKVFAEAMGRHFAAHKGLEVVAVRFGGVYPDDQEPKRPAQRAVWLPRDECVSVLHAAISAPLPAGNFALIVGVGDGPQRVHSYGPDPIWPAPEATQTGENARNPGVS